MSENQTEDEFPATQDPEIPEPEESLSEQIDLEEIEASADIGENAHQVVTALLAHQQDLVRELREVYEQLEQVREVEYGQLETRVVQAEAAVAAVPDQVAAAAAHAEEVAAQLRSSDPQAAVAELKQAYAEQLAERDARIAALNSRLETLESGLGETAAAAESAHEKLEVLARETGSSLLDSVVDQAKSRLNNVRRRFKR